MSASFYLSEEEPAMTRITPFSIGRRWRCIRPDRISFDFVIVAPGNRPDTKKCRLEPLPGQERLFGEERVKTFRGADQSYPHRHLKKVAVLVPISLDDIAAEL
jgi:hypothetical protein